MEREVLSSRLRKIGWITVTVCAFFLLWLVCFAAKADAKTITIKNPEDLKNINWKAKGFGPGNTYKLGADMTLGDGEYATVPLTKGKFVIDLNGHTVQNANHGLTVFHIQGATVLLKDSKAKANKPSVRSYGAGAVQITSGKLTIQNGNYLGASDGQNNPSALHVGGGTCIVNGGYFYGDYVAAATMGGTLRINGGKFQAGYTFAVMRFGAGNIQIMKGTFLPGTTTYGFRFPFGSYIGQGSDGNENIKGWLTKGSSFSKSFENAYWNMQSSLTAYPTIANYWAVAYVDPYSYSNANITVKTTAAPPATTIRSLKAASNSLNVKWQKKSSKTTGYVIQYSTSKSFKNAKKLIVKGASKGAVTIKKLKAKKKYFVRVRTYRSFNGTTLYSKWSAAKSKNTK